jgi:malonate decarboxylase alpha subunit
LEERKAAIAAVAGATEIGLRADPKRTGSLRARGIVAMPEDLGVRRTEARRTLLAARSIDDLVAWSDGLYQPPAKFRSWKNSDANSQL